MARFYLSHTVTDFDKWKPLFDADEENRKGAGLGTIGVYRQAGEGIMYLLSLKGMLNQ